MLSFSNRIAVFTGGTSGIGLGMSRTFAARGMKLMIADLDEVAQDAAVTEFESAGIDVVGHPCDVSKLEEVQALADRTMDASGAEDSLFNGPIQRLRRDPK